MHAPSPGPRPDDTAAKVEFLRSPDAYAERPRSVTTRQTHMSWVFLTDRHVYKLKKPVSFPFLDYSSLDRREAACREEIAVNRRLAATVYLGVVPLTCRAGGYAIGGGGTVADWLVVMRRLPERQLLDGALARGRPLPQALDRLATFLAAFYGHQLPVLRAPSAHLGHWRAELHKNRLALADPRLGVDPRIAIRIDRAARRFLADRGGLVEARAAAGRIVDGHGDLRPEHVFIGSPVAIIDRLEFSRAFRIADPFDELALLDVECEILGHAAVGAAVTERVSRHLRDGVDPELYAFYRLCRAVMRARLILGHLLTPDGRSPERWRPLAARYLAIAGAAAVHLDRAGGGHARRRLPANASFTPPVRGSVVVL